MSHRIEVMFKRGAVDAAGKSIAEKISGLLSDGDIGVRVVDVYRIDARLSGKELDALCGGLFSDPIIQDSSHKKPLADGFDWIVEVGFLPGVTDNAGRTAKNAIYDALGKSVPGVYTSKQYLISGRLEREDVERVARGVLANGLIERWAICPREEWDAENGMGWELPIVKMKHQPYVKRISLDLPDGELEKLSKDRSLALGLEDMQAIRDHFSMPDVIAKRESLGIGRGITDVELEVIAQTQSEHCKHRIFNAVIDYEDCGKHERIDSLFKTYIMASSEEVAKKRGWIVSMFWDNAGVVSIDDEWSYAVKCETHNSPSALDPYGGSITGIVGVYRDPMGTGMGSKIVAGAYGFCTASPFYSGGLEPAMPPRRLLEGIVAGVRDGGNKSGVPTQIGTVMFDDGWIGKPLVYVTAIGIMPKEVNGKPAHLKSLRDGDLIVMVGGRVGKDGIHGVTESSLEHGSWITAGHVQIGDPFTQKKVHDFLLEARDAGLYSMITDVGGGGISSAIGETARMANGCRIELDKVPLKYFGLDPWEILVSESQERMLLGVSPGKLEGLEKLAKKHDVETTAVGSYCNSGMFDAVYNGAPVASLSMEFLHSGFPAYMLKARFDPSKEEEPSIVEEDASRALLEMVARENIASKEWIQRQYDHEVQGGSVIKPFLGVSEDVCSDAAVFRPVLGKDVGLAIAQGMCPKYSKIDAYSMAACSVDEAVRRVISVGASLDKISLNDNFCWPNPVYEPEKNPDGMHKLAQLVRANKALYDCTTFFGTPCVSGKDSMFIDGNLRGEDGKTQKVSGLPTVQFTAVGVVDDVSKCVSLDFKDAGDVVYLIGETNNELGASEYYEMKGFVGKNVPSLSREKALAAYRAVSGAVSAGMVKSCHGVYRGGLGVALAFKAMAGGIGAEISLSGIPGNAETLEQALFSESPGRFIVTISAGRKTEFEKALAGAPYAEIGRVVANGSLEIIFRGREAKARVQGLKSAWQSTFRGFW